MNQIITDYGLLARALDGRLNHEIKLSVPIEDGGKGGFDYTLHIASAFIDVAHNVTTKIYNFSSKH